MKPHSRRAVEAIEAFKQASAAAAALLLLNLA